MRGRFRVGVSDRDRIMDRFGRLNYRSRGDHEWVRVQILFTRGVKGKGNCVKGCYMALRGDSTLDLEPYVPY